ADANQCVPEHEAEGRNRADPPGGVHRGLIDDGGHDRDPDHGYRGDGDRDVRCAPGAVDAAHGRVAHAVARHRIDEPGAGVDAGQRAGEHAADNPDVEDVGEEADPGLCGQVRQRGGAAQDAALDILEAVDLGVGDDDVEQAHDQAAPEDGAGHV